MKDNGVGVFFVTETWLSAQGDEEKTVELAPSGFDVKTFSLQSQSRGGGIASIFKSIIDSGIKFKANFYFIHSSFEVVQTSITLQHNTLHFLCVYHLLQTDETILLTLCLLNSCLTYLIM